MPQLSKVKIRAIGRIKYLERNSSYYPERRGNPEKRGYLLYGMNSLD
jgi:hypothetical protein